jgi:hypothetical protein
MKDLRFSEPQELSATCGLRFVKKPAACCEWTWPDLVCFSAGCWQFFAKSLSLSGSAETGYRYLQSTSFVRLTID